MSLYNRIGKSFGISTSKNTYTFIKYNFFNVYVFDTLYSYFDRFLISMFMSDFLNSDL